jgi:transcriptional regulator with XRE-family HTH domain
MTTRGERLRGFLLARTGGTPGWQARLVEASGVKRQTISKWTNPAFDRYPDLEALAQVAGALRVETWEIVAAMDGVEPPPGIELETRIVALEETLAELLRNSRTSAGSAALPAPRAREGRAE